MRTYDLTTSNAIDAKLRLAGCASSTGIGVLTGGVGVRRDSTGPLGTGAALLTALVWELCGGDGAVSTGTRLLSAEVGVRLGEAVHRSRGTICESLGYVW